MRSSCCAVLCSCSCCRRCCCCSSQALHGPWDCVHESCISPTFGTRHPLTPNPPRRVPLPTAATAGASAQQRGELPIDDRQLSARLSKGICAALARLLLLPLHRCTLGPPPRLPPSGQVRRPRAYASAVVASIIIASVVGQRCAHPLLVPQGLATAGAQVIKIQGENFGPATAYTNSVLQAWVGVTTPLAVSLGFSLASCTVSVAHTQLSCTTPAGTGAGMSNFGPLAQLADGLALRFHSMEPVGDDVRLVARVAGRDIF